MRHRLQRGPLTISPANQQILAEESRHSIEPDWSELAIEVIKSLVLQSE